MTKDLEKKYQNLNKKRRYELLNYDKKRHLELLNKQGDEFKSKLRTYSIILIDHLNWEIRDQYLELLENYREEKINSFDFRIRFCERYESLLFLPTYNDYYRNYMVKIKLLFIESYSSSAVEKRMPIKNFLSQFHRSNQKMATIKKEILIIFKDLQKKDLIDSRFKLISATGEEDKLTKLSTSSFTKYDIICFYEKIESKEIKAN